MDEDWEDECDRIDILAARLAKALHKRMGSDDGFILIVATQCGITCVQTDIPNARAARAALEATLATAPVDPEVN